MATSKEELKQYFQAGDTPTQENFEELIDGFRHIDDGKTISSVQQSDTDTRINLSDNQSIVIPKSANLNDQHGEPIGVFDNFTLLKAQNPPCRLSIVLGFTTPDDGGGGIFRWNATSTDVEVEGMRMKSDHTNGRYLRQLNDGLRMNVKWFGAISDGSQDCTDVVNAALAYLPKTEAVSSGWGIGTIYFPKGIYLINGTISRTGLIGLKFMGDGEFATTITRTNDTGIMFSLTTYISVSFELMDFEHITTQDQSLWTNILFNLNGSGGGRNFYLNRISSRGFNIVINHSNTINENTNYISACTFSNCTTFLDSENAQAVVNEYKNVTWAGKISQVFHVAGNWQTLVENANITIDGTFIRYKNLPNYNGRGFTVKNTRFAFTSAHITENPIPKIIHAVGNKIGVNFRMIDCSLSGGGIPHPSTRAFTIEAIPYISIEGGVIEGILDLTHTTGQRLQRAPYIRFTDMQISNPNTWNIIETGTGGRRVAPIVFKNARLSQAENAGPINLTFSRQGAPYLSPRVTTALIHPSEAASNFFANTIRDFKLEFYGQRVMINKLLWTCKRVALNQTGRKINIYSDELHTNLLYEFEIPANTVNDTTYIIPTDNEIISTGLYLEVITPEDASTHVGYLIADYTSV